MRDAIAEVCTRRGWTLDGDVVKVDLPSGRHQDVRFEQYESSGENFLRLYSVLGDATAVDERRLRAALRLNWTFPFGDVAIGSVDDGPEQLLLCETLLIDNVSDRRLSLAIQSVASTADRYEDAVFGTDTH